MQNVAKPRITAVEPGAMSEEQRMAAEVLTSGPRQSLRGPFKVLLNSPGLFGVTQAMGSYLRFENQISANLRELAILVTARHWGQEYEWRVHAKIANETGLSDDAIAAIAMGKEPPKLTEQESVVYDFCRQLHNSKTVDDEIFAQAELLLGKSGVIDLCAICGYYAMLAMVMNVAQNPLPEGASPFHDEKVQ